MMTLALKITAVVCFVVGVYFVVWEGEGAALILIGAAILLQAERSAALIEVRDARVRTLIAFVGVVLLVIGAFLLIDRMEEPPPELPPPST